MTKSHLQQIQQAPEKHALQAELRHHTAPDGVEIPYYVWPLASPRSIIVFNHGLKSHAGWFLDTGRHFAEHGIKVYAFDRRGSGHSHEPRGHIDDYQQWILDLQRVIELAKQEHPDCPIHVMGHCFGARIAMGHAILHPEAAKSLIMIAPPQFSLKVDITLADKINVLKTLMRGQQYTVRVPVDDTMFTRIPEKLDFIKHDELRLQEWTTGCCWQSNKLDKFVAKHISQISKPTLILLANEDDVVDNRRIGSQLAQRLSSRHLAIETFDSYHHLFFEASRDKVLNRVINWLDEGY